MPKVDYNDQIKRTGYVSGDKPEAAYQEYYEYPADFRPWTFNYKKDGILLGFFAILCYGYF